MRHEIDDHPPLRPLVGHGSLLLCWALPAQAVRIKDIATFSGVRDNQLIGYGLVVGLAGTGDKKVPSSPSVP